MSGSVARLAGAVVGSLVALGAGWLIGGGWWVAAAATVAGSVWAVVDRQAVHLHALGTLALAGGAVATDQRWLIVILVAGFVAGVEAMAAADRVTVVRPEVPDGRAVLTAVAGAALIATVVLVAGALAPGGWALAGVASALAAGSAMRVIAR